MPLMVSLWVGNWSIEKGEGQMEGRWAARAVILCRINMAALMCQALCWPPGRHQGEVTPAPRVSPPNTGEREVSVDKCRRWQVLGCETIGISYSVLGLSS